jgi:non-homologous end joining protein Ku
MQVMHYANEVRDFGAIPKAEQERLTAAELNLATGLVEKLSSPEFEPEIYRNERRAPVRAMLEEKARGHEITVARPAPPRAGDIDIYAALRKSLDTARPRAKASDRGKRKKA